MQIGVWGHEYNKPALAAKVLQGLQCFSLLDYPDPQLSGHLLQMIT